ncbi:hypothetical protein ACIQGV_33255, partial [Streptomyces sp. NPDC093094]
APVESLMPLRLARYGVPLAETAPAGLAAAGIDPARPAAAEQYTVEQVTVPGPREGSAAVGAAQPGTLRTAGPVQALEQAAPVPAAGPRPVLQPGDETVERFADAYAAFVEQFQIQPTPTQWAFWLRDTLGLSTAAGDPLTDEQVQPLLRALKERYAPGEESPAGTADEPPTDELPTDEWFDYFLNAWRAYRDETGTAPGADALAAYVYRQDGVTGADGGPVTGEDLADYVAAIVEREQAGTPDAPAPQRQKPSETAAAPQTQTEKAAGQGKPAEGAELTAQDRYYLAWTAYQDEHGTEPGDEQLSAYLTAQGLHGRGGKPVGPSGLRRHFLRWRVYSVWAEQRLRTEEPSATAVARACAARGITGQYNRPVSAEYVAGEAGDFERRWRALARYRAQAQQ